MLRRNGNHDATHEGAEHEEHEGTGVVAFRPRPPREFEIEELQNRISSGIRYEMGIDSFFGASHSMRPEGERHTHSFRVQATFLAEHVDSHGMIYGFREVTDLLESEARRYANRYLNEIEPFTIVQPTGENLAAVILKSLQTRLTHDMPTAPRLTAITLWENPVSYVRVTTGNAA